MDLDFELLRLGNSGAVTAIPTVQDADLQKLPKSTVPVGIPPVFPTVNEELESYLTNIEDLPIHDYERAQKFWPRKGCAEKLLSTNLCPLQTRIVVDRNPKTGQLLGFKEADLTNTDHTAKNSLSLKRKPEPVGVNIKGSSTNYPFWPGGLDEPSLDNLVKESSTAINFENDLLSVPVGFEEGMAFKQADKNTENILKIVTENTDVGVISLADILSQSADIEFSDEETQEQTREEDKHDPGQVKEDNSHDEDLDVLVKKTDDGNSKVSSKAVVEKKEEWSVAVDISTPVDDFYERIPDMAYKWPFELDIFQKQAIMHLEDHDSVFVAAHTSAGKTVVAEYAIALSLKHMTRTIYTSPIKALSNQKFRDFKQTFVDVGLITGDVQIRPEAACLIMTTEILRSMLYNGSDVIRDLEWVIFDEVHYINDSERGVVWEEVLIMLPPHVNIILLSATVPNTAEFAGWVGRTKKKKVYVISTVKRPVPLEHYIYTGNSSKTSNELFMILDAKRNFLTTGYAKALDAKKSRASKASQSYGPKGPRSGNPHQDKNIWMSLIEMLKKKDRMPVVAFTFSKKKIDENATNLSNLDLTTSSEKSDIHVFFQKCVSRLKGSDKSLPQVTQMQERLKRGIGVHHSGVLPILKEVVELLFCRGLVKVLFATETFAMGVNMPARTVVFDSIRKHDGKCMRDLLTGEYIQMAGRSGRRGLDTTGMVIILCKGDVPEMSDLHKMMLGKPTTLQSQFRLTYSMILNLLRVEELRVEDMMKRSFSEFHSQNKVAENKEALEELSLQVEGLQDLSPFACGGDLDLYYQAHREYCELKADLQKVMMSHPQAIKALGPGRIIIVDNNTFKNSLGVILQTSSASSKERTFTALVICEQVSGKETAASKKCGSDVIDPRSVTDIRLFRPEGQCGHRVVTLKAEDISVITIRTLKITAERIIDDFKKRQQPRFRNDPPSQSTSMATQELLRISEENPEGLDGLDPVNDLHIRDLDLVDQIQRLQFLKKSFSTYRCIHSPDFLECFNQMRENMKIKEKYENLRFLMSDESLQLLPEYQQRIEVLKILKYLDPIQNSVELKGRVACEISQHELIITELVFENELNGLNPNEIAALLSCVVFEQKHCSEPELAPDLIKAKDRFLDIARKVGNIQKQCELRIPVEDYVDQFKFGLMEVVFEWARGMPFSDIIKLTDVQEGIIVRCIQRLDEVLKDVRNAARIVGDPILFSKMEEASKNIKRDIVFAASLYTQ